jgi:hypothetical protein
MSIATVAARTGSESAAGSASQRHADTRADSSYVGREVDTPLSTGVHALDGT